MFTELEYAGMGKGGSGPKDRNPVPVRVLSENGGRETKKHGGRSCCFLLRSTAVKTSFWSRRRSSWIFPLPQHHLRHF